MGSFHNNFWLRRGAATGAVLLGTLGLASGASAAGLPAAPMNENSSPHYVRVKPAYIQWSGDATGVVSGHGGAYKSPISWTKWDSREADGNATSWIDNCKPDCATGHYDGIPTRVKLWDPKVLHGKLIFTRLRWSAGGETYNSKATYKGSYGSYTYWGWSFPTVTGPHES
ncbi:MAG: hypothetical protein J2O48_10630 [Solirubrobacterales bacterium]|nr:hypothetical protein [Solirubrobacterales bacterium]